MKPALKISKAVDSSNKAINTEIESIESKVDLIDRINKEVAENSLRELTDNEKSFIIINNLLSDDVDNKNQSLSIRGGLLIECAKLSLNKELNIYRCKVDNENTKTISKVEIEHWIQSIYDKGLRNFYDKMDFKKFKAFNSKYYSHFESLRDIALAVNFFIGNYHNGSTKVEQIPLCKVGTLEGNNTTSDLIYTVEEGQFFRANKVYMRLDFLKSLQNTVKFPIKDRILSKENGFTETEEIINQLKYKLFSVNQIINIANQIINFKEVTKNDGIDTQVQFQNHFDSVTGLINSEEVKKNEIIINNQGTPKLLNMLDVYISTALIKKEYKNILRLLIKQVAESSLDDKEFMKHLDKNNFIFVAQSFTENSQTPNQIKKLIK